MRFHFAVCALGLVAKHVAGQLYDEPAGNAAQRGQSTSLRR